MKTLSQLIKEAEERFWQNYTQATDRAGERKLKQENPWVLKDFIAEEIKNAIQTAFRETSVEEEEQKPCHEINLTRPKYWCDSCKNDTGKCEFVELSNKRNEALSDTKIKQNEFLNN